MVEVKKVLFKDSLNLKKIEKLVDISTAPASEGYEYLVQKFLKTLSN